MPFRGLTWDHPRGFDALEYASRQAGGIIQWKTQPLEGFESAPIDQICEGFDLVVLDHPHLGDAVAADCLQPMNRLLDANDLQDLRRRIVGPCFESYEAQTRLWALPLDAAAQISVSRPDLLEEMPADWDEVGKLARMPGFIMSLAGPHAFLTLLSLCASCDDNFGPVKEAYFQPAHDAAIDRFGELAVQSDPLGFTGNPITILNAMRDGVDLRYCPLIFGYVTYARQSSDRPLQYQDAPAWQPGRPPRAVLGGTGIALTRHAKTSPELAGHLRWLMSDMAQSSLIPQNNGQPSALTAWQDHMVNAPVNNFYLRSLTTLQHAFLRPRHGGFVPSQSQASAWLRDALQEGFPGPRKVRDTVNKILMRRAA